LLGIHRYEGSKASIAGFQTMGTDTQKERDPKRKLVYKAECG